MGEYSIQLIGVEPSKTARLPKKILDCCKAIVVSKRFKPLLKEQYPPWVNCTIIPITPLPEAFSRIKEQLQLGNVAVLASGDPLFFGIGKKIVEVFGKERTVIHPASSAIQLAFARFGISWEDASLISLHGRNYDFNVGTLLASHKSVVLTDDTNSPDAIGKKLYDFLGYNQKLFTLSVAENLGMEGERCISGSPELIADETFGPLCCVIISGPKRIKTASKEGKRGELLNCSDISISCSEVETFALQSMEIVKGSVLWCVNASSFAFSAAQSIPDLTVYSVELTSDKYRTALERRDSYRLYNVYAELSSEGTISGRFAQPDRIFINWPVRNFEENVKFYSEKLGSSGKITVSIAENLPIENVAELLHKEGLRVEVKTVNIKKTDYPPVEGKVDHTTTLITGTKVQDRIR